MPTYLQFIIKSLSLAQERPRGIFAPSPAEGWGYAPDFAAYPSNLRDWGWGTYKFFAPFVAF
jgi:hypothetical protein